MWIFNYEDFSIRDIVEIADYEIIIDEETNAKSTINVLKQTGAKAKDIVAVKKNNEVVYWGIIEEIQNEDGTQKYTYVTEYLTNIFDRKIPLELIGIKITYVAKIADESTGTHKEVKILDGVPKVVAGTTGDYFNFIYTPNGFYIEYRGKYFTYNQNNSVTLEELSGMNQLWVVDGIRIQRTIKTSSSLYLNIIASLGSDLVVSSTPSTFINAQLATNDIIKNVGVEDQLAYAIRNNFTNSGDTLLNIDYIDLKVESHTTKQTQVSNVDNGIYNLHTWLTNCNQYYNVNYLYSVVKVLSKWCLRITIKVYEKPKELIDTNAQNISNYTEVFETDVMAKVVVLYDKVDGQDNKGNYTLFLKTDRTTTTDENDANRAEGNTTTIYTENYEDANQSALDEMKSNEYNHNITFNLDKYIPEGTPIAIKTKNQLIYNTYISQVKITPKEFYEYICGNIRINFIDKLKKEKQNA